MNNRQWIEPIIDRSRMDILSRTPRAYLNVVDIRRIESNIVYLSELLGIHGYNFEAIEAKDWNNDDITKVADIRSICENIVSIVRAYHELEGYAQLLEITFESLDYTDVNAIERVLFELHRLLMNSDSNTSLGWAIGMAHAELYVSA